MNNDTEVTLSFTVTREYALTLELVDMAIFLGTSTKELSEMLREGDVPAGLSAYQVRQGQLDASLEMEEHSVDGLQIF